MNISISEQELKDRLITDGCIILKDVLSAHAVKTARNEVEEWIQRDLMFRRATTEAFVACDGPAGQTHFDKGKHLLINFFGRSPTLDQLANALVSNKEIMNVVRSLLGKHCKLRGFNIRRMTGNPENSAMCWHRDNRGEFTFAIPLDTTQEYGDSATAYVPGSHFYPYCPMREARISMPLEKITSRLLPANRRLSHMVETMAKGIGSQPGDAYLFLGDVWHARQPNLSGRENTVLFFALFPSEIKFPEPVSIPSDEVLSQLPQPLRTLVDFRLTPDNKDRTAFIYKMERIQQTQGSSWLFVLARWECQISNVIAQLFKTLNALFMKARDWYRLHLKG
ncbi:phytanoyl-CoA dioxygenase family protein [Kamptonema cortianum]|nr:phytanoyl-CoA dioxygenase family protein [Oscillatoria laete-virens]MDK3155367.1 phytanoyl-CoA dioxygenase family protein [Kamptonema cortianum]MDL5046116.1 phytanoyl-CoA dioxygenase family protein [Oscillatoria amoena NRMC-F 0135]MDL5052817.1 phytanoyl-CoA dioxygenase family protein [Oscillatoria laete-virens NRMC-F 0139]